MTKVSLVYFMTPILIITVVLITLALIAYFLSKKSYLAKEQAEEFCKQIQKTSKLEPSHSLLESHKILVSSLSQMLGKKANAAKLLNKIKSRIENEKELWKYHRMRNQAAHEMYFEVSTTDAQKARKVFKRVLQDLSK